MVTERGKNLSRDLQWLGELADLHVMSEGWGPSQVLRLPSKEELFGDFKRISALITVLGPARIALPL